MHGTLESQSYMPNDTALEVSELLAGLAGGDDHVKDSFNGAYALGSTLNAIFDRDICAGKISEHNGLICCGQTSPEEVVRKFGEICIEKWSRETRPSLPAQTLEQIKTLGVNADQIKTGHRLDLDEQAAARAAMLVAARAEMIRGFAPKASCPHEENPYHNADHTGHVAAIGGYLGRLNNQISGRSVEFHLKDQLKVLIATNGHDIDHKGEGNPAGDIYKNEMASYQVIRPLMQAVGMNRADMKDIQILFRVTSPNGPQRFMKDVAAAMREGREINMNAIDPEGKYTDLYRLGADLKLLEMAAIVSDADLFASAGAGLKVNEEMSRRLTDELNQSGLDIDLNGPGPRKGFMTGVVGAEGFASAAGRNAFNEGFHELLYHTRQQLGEAPRPERN